MDTPIRRSAIARKSVPSATQHRERRTERRFARGICEKGVGVCDCRMPFMCWLCFGPGSRLAEYLRLAFRPVAAYRRRSDCPGSVRVGAVCAASRSIVHREFTPLSVAPPRKVRQARQSYGTPFGRCSPLRMSMRGTAAPPSPGGSGVVSAWSAVTVCGRRRVGQRRWLQVRGAGRGPAGPAAPLRSRRGRPGNQVDMRTQWPGAWSGELGRGVRGPVRTMVGRPDGRHRVLRRPGARGGRAAGRAGGRQRAGRDPRRAGRRPAGDWSSSTP
jgi:hypothetical protein